MKSISYKIKENNTEITKRISIDDNLYKQFSDANTKYETSRKYIMTYWYNIWNKNYKDYLLYAWDREMHIDNWQSNMVYWLIRSTIDNYISFASEKPLGYKVVATNQDWFKNIKPVQQVLWCNADKTLFNREIQEEIIEALIVWNFCFKTVYIKNKQTEKAISLVDDIYLEYEFDTWVNNTPKTVWIDVFKVFPDVYAWPLRYITERDVVSHEEIIKRFKSMIMSKTNELSKIKWVNLEEMLKFIPINNSLANFEDFWRVRSEVFRAINEQLWIDDALPKLSYNNTTPSSTLTPDTDSDLTKWLIEYKCFTDNWRVTLTLNWIPFYTWKNPLWKINYHYGNTYHTRNRFSEWIWYLLRQVEAMWTSFINVLIDWVRSINTPNFTAPQDLFIDPKQVENSKPWDIWWTDWDRWEEMRRVDKWNITDFWMLWIIDNRWQIISWVSDYNSWISSKERVATAVASLVESTNRKILTFLRRFSNTVADVWYFQLFLCRKYWTKPQWWYNMEDWEQIVWETPISWKDLSGWFNISLETEWLLSVNKETEINKFLSMYDKFAGSWVINASALISDTFKNAWLDPNKYVINPNVTIPADKVNQPAPWELQTEVPPAWTETTPTLEAQQMQQAINPQTWA